MWRSACSRRPEVAEFSCIALDRQQDRFFEHRSVWQYRPTADHLMAICAERHVDAAPAISIRKFTPPGNEMLAMAPFLAMPAARVVDDFVLSTRGDRYSPRITGRIVAEAIDTHVAIDVDAPVNNEKFPLLHFEYRNGSSAIDIKKAPQNIERRIFSCGSAAACLTYPRFLRNKSDKVLSRTGTSERIVYTPLRSPVPQPAFLQ